MEEQTPETAPEEQPTEDPQAPPPPPPGEPQAEPGAVPETTVNEDPQAPPPTPDAPQAGPGAVPETTVVEGNAYKPSDEVKAFNDALKRASQPTVGRIVHYTLSRQDAEHANRRRTTPQSIRERTNAGTWSVGAQAHIGNEVREGQVLPMVVVAVCYPGDVQGRVNGQVFLDGNDVLFVTSRPQGTEPGTWAWPQRS